MVSAGKEFFSKRYESLGGALLPVEVPQGIRVNSLRAPRDIVQRLSSSGVVLEKVSFLKNGFVVNSSRTSVGALPEFLLGYYYVQELAAQLPVTVLNPIAGETILDCCAAPGGKTSQMAALMKNQGLIVACELKPARVASLFTSLDRCGVKNVVAFQGDVSKARRLGLVFDKVLLDAPCSGNYASDESWLDRRSMEGILISASVQRRLLRLAIDVLRPGGTLVYSTCSLEPEENELNIAWAVENLPVRVEPVNTIGDPGLTSVFGKKLPDDISMCRRLWPHKTGTEGFFIAKLVKNES